MRQSVCTLLHLGYTFNQQYRSYLTFAQLTHWDEFLNAYVNR